MGVNSVNNVEVDGMVRHVLDVRRVFKVDSQEEETMDGGVNEHSEGIVEPVLRPYPDRTRNPPGITRRSQDNVKLYKMYIVVGFLKLNLFLFNVVLILTSGGLVISLGTGP